MAGTVWWQGRYGIGTCGGVVHMALPQEAQKASELKARLCPSQDHPNDRLPCTAEELELKA